MRRLHLPLLLAFSVATFAAEVEEDKKKKVNKAADLPEVVITATRSATPLSQVPAAMMPTIIRLVTGSIHQAPVSAMRNPAATTPAYATAIDTKLYAQPVKGEVVRSLRAGTALTPTGERKGLFVEVSDAYGSKGWVSVEDLK